MPLAATLSGCEDSSREKKNKVINQISSTPKYSKKVTSIFNAIKNYDFYRDVKAKHFLPTVTSYDVYQPYQIGDAVGYLSEWCLILQTPGLNENLYSSNSTYQQISLGNLSPIVGPHLSNPTLDIFKVLPEGAKGLTYKGHIFDDGQVTAISSILDQLGYGYELFFRDGWRAELVFVLSDNIVISISDPYMPLYRSGEFSDPRKKLSIGKIIDFIGDHGLAAYIMYCAASGFEDMFAGPNMAVALWLASGVYTWVDKFIEDIETSRRADDIPSAEEIRELDKYAKIVLPKSFIDKSFSYPLVHKDQIRIYLLGRLPGESVYSLEREETFIKRKLMDGDVFGLSRFYYYAEEDRYAWGKLAWFHQEPYESIKRTLEQNGIHYNLMYLTNIPEKWQKRPSVYQLVFILDTPNKVVVALNSYFQGYPLW